MPGRSILTSDPVKLAEKAGSGRQVGNLRVAASGSKENVDFGHIIGEYICKGDIRGCPTIKVAIHYSKDGIHIVSSIQ